MHFLRAICSRVPKLIRRRRTIRYFQYTRDPSFCDCSLNENSFRDYRFNDVMKILGDLSNVSRVEAFLREVARFSPILLDMLVEITFVLNSLNSGMPHER